MLWKRLSISIYVDMHRQCLPDLLLPLQSLNSSIEFYLTVKISHQLSISALCFVLISVAHVTLCKTNVPFEYKTVQKRRHFRRLIWVLLFLDDWSNAGVSRKDISSTVTMAPKSRTLFKYLNIKRSSLDHKAHFPIVVFVRPTGTYDDICDTYHNDHCAAIFSQNA